MHLAPGPRRRPWLAAGFLALAVVLVAVSEVLSRRTWTGDVLDDVSGPLPLLALVSAVIAVVFLWPDDATRARARAAGAGPVMRGVRHLAVALGAAFVGFLLGSAHFSATECGNGGDCDLAGIEGMVWALAAVVVCILGSVVLEVVRLVRARRSVADGRPV